MSSSNPTSPDNVSSHWIFVKERLPNIAAGLITGILSTSVFAAVDLAFKTKIFSGAINSFAGRGTIVYLFSALCITSAFSVIPFWPFTRVKSVLVNIYDALLFAASFVLSLAMMWSIIGLLPALNNNEAIDLVILTFLALGVVTVIVLKVSPEKFSSAYSRTSKSGVFFFFCLSLLVGVLSGLFASRS